MRASQEWWSRPDDQRFLSLAELRNYCLARADACETNVSRHGQLEVVGSQNGGRNIVLEDGINEDPLGLTHWSFGQLASRAKVPAKWAREDTHPEIAALAMNYGLQVVSPSDDSMVMTYRGPEGHVVRAMTGSGYGRIYDHKIASNVIHMNEASNNRWQVPSASYSQANPRRATTLYASDRDIFIFLVDPNNPIELPNPDGRTEVLYRGFYVWNSEVGSKTFGLTTFLYRYVCDNRIIWGAEDVREFSIRHTSSAPERFEREAIPMLTKYAESSAQKTVEVAKRAMRMEVAKTDEGVQDWLTARSFNVKEAKNIIQKAREEEGEARTVWELVQGGTALARGIAHTDNRVDFERRASGLMARAA